MRMQTTQVFQYNELSDDAKEKARDWYREGLHDFLDFDLILDDAKTIGGFLGWKIDKIYFSGFSNQGDGAQFVGAWHASAVNVTGLKNYAPQDTELARIGAALETLAFAYPETTASVKSVGHYSHEHCTEFACGFVDSIYELDDTAHTSTEWETRKDKAASDAETFIELSRDFMRWIYQQLEKENDYQYSDDAVIVSIEVNEYEFTADGKRA